MHAPKNRPSLLDTYAAKKQTKVTHMPHQAAFSPMRRRNVWKTAELVNRPEEYSSDMMGMVQKKRNSVQTIKNTRQPEQNEKYSFKGTYRKTT